MTKYKKGWEKDSYDSISDLVENDLMDFDDDPWSFQDTGVLEKTQERIIKVNKAIGRMIERLHSKGIFDLEDVGFIIDEKIDED